MAIHPSVSWKFPTWPTGHSNIFQLHGLHQGRFSLLISDVPGSHWKPLLVGSMSHPPMESTYESLGIIPPNRGGWTYAKKSKHQKKGKPMATLNGSFKWTIEMDVENPSAPQVTISSSKNMPLNSLNLLH